MNAAEINQIIERGSGEYFSGLIQEVRANLGTSHYRRLSNEELSRRASAVYRHLEQWIASRDEVAVRSAGEDLGKRRFGEGIPLGQVVLALILEENYLRRYLSGQGVTAGGGWGDAITEFFQKMIYNTARGYEVALAHSNRLAHRATTTVQPSEPAEQKDVPKPEGEMQISRGGDTGEVAG